MAGTAALARPKGARGLAFSTPACTSPGCFRAVRNQGPVFQQCSTSQCHLPAGGMPFKGPPQPGAGEPDGFSDSAEPGFELETWGGEGRVLGRELEGGGVGGRESAASTRLFAVK